MFTNSVTDLLTNQIKVMVFNATFNNISVILYSLFRLGNTVCAYIHLYIYKSLKNFNVLNCQSHYNHISKCLPNVYQMEQT